MPANLSPDFKNAEADFRKAQDPGERLRCLREMLRTIPKHKGTEHLQGDIKSRIKQLTEELAGPKKGASRGGPPTVIHPEGAAQIALLGPPNSGKSALHHKLTHSHAHVGPYPFTTQFPLPGMMPFEDIHIQLVDLPPVSSEHPVPWLFNALQPADACLLIVDVSDPDCVGQMSDLQDELKKRKIVMTSAWGRQSDTVTESDASYDPFSISLPALMIMSKADRMSAPDDDLGVFLELSGASYPLLQTSAETGQGLDLLGPWLFRELDIVRVYTKAPGRPPDKERPFTVRRGQTIQDVAVQIHKDIAGSFQYARIWGKGHFDGQQVGRDHPVADGDVLEIHA